VKKKTEDEKILVEIQKPKMTELWNNAQDEGWEKALERKGVKKFEKLAAFGRKFAKKKGITQKDMR